MLRGEGDQPILEKFLRFKIHHSGYPNFYDTLVHNPYSNRYLAIRRVPVRGIWITATLQSSTPRLQSRFDSCRRKDPPENGRRFRFTAAAIQRTFYGKLGGSKEGRGQGYRNLPVHTRIVDVPEIIGSTKYRCLHKYPQVGLAARSKGAP